MDRNSKGTQEPKKRFPGGFFLFLLASFFIILTVQNITNTKKGKVSFSHQIEHLVNLDLLDKSESTKTSLKDNLVTFKGKFNEGLSDDAKARYRYLQLLNEQKTLSEGERQLATELNHLQGGVREAAIRYLTLSGITIPKGGYSVVSPNYDTTQRENSVTIKNIPSSDMMTLPRVMSLYNDAKNDPNSSNVQLLGKDVQLLIANFQSPILGIGNEGMKKQLKDASLKVDQVMKQDGLTPQENLATYALAIDTLKGVVKQLDQKQDAVSLQDLRSVRNYLVDLKQYQITSESAVKNEAFLNKARKNVANVVWFFNNKELSTKALEKQSPEEFSLWFAQTKKEWENFSSNKGLAFKAPDQPRNTVLEKTFKSKEPAPNYFSYIFTFLPILLIVMLLYFVFSKQMKGMGSSAMNFGKSPAKMLNQSTNKVTFKDVAGVEEAKEELMEIVDFLKDPGKFTALGARIPKGVLCVGAPGTGKTLIAKAVAGEADRPFFSISGSDFVEMFVGVGASRIRDLFAQAKKTAPCIIFIDEIDAVGRHRGAGIGGGHDEREQTLNQLLVEMDGFNTNEGVILMAATNRPDVLDKALLRPGRFDRRVHLELPDIKGRLEILKVHARKIKMDDSVELKDIARNTPGSSGADLMNILNEAALLSARKGRSAVTQQDTLEACDKVRFGKERRSLELDDKEKYNTAYHESGHAIVGLCVEHGDPVEKVTIIPRGMSLGATHFVPEKNRVSYWKKELIDQLAVLMGGRISEEIFLGDVSSGAQMDISQATSIAKSMVCEWGMTDKLGAVAYGDSGQSGMYMMPGQSEKNYSDETAKIIDEEMKRFLDEANQQATNIINKNREKVNLMAKMLLEFESLNKSDVTAIMDGSWDAEKKREILKQDEEKKKIVPPPPPKDEEEENAGPPQDVNPTPQQI